MKQMDLDVKRSEDYDVIGGQAEENSINSSSNDKDTNNQISIDKVRKLRLIIKLIVDETMAEYTDIFCDEVRKIMKENEHEQKKEMVDLVSEIMKKNKRELQDTVAKEMDYQFRNWQEEQVASAFASERKKRLI